MTENGKDKDPHALVAAPFTRTPLARAPMIAWGEEFKGWKPVKQIQWLKELASSLNHALDRMQRERNEAVLIAKAKEKIVISQHRRIEEVQALLAKQITDHNADTQSRIAEIQELKRDLHSRPPH